MPEHGCPQQGDLGGSAVTQALHSKSSHAVESVQNPGMPTFSNIPPYPREHHLPWDHARDTHTGTYCTGMMCGGHSLRAPSPARCVRAPTSSDCCRWKAASGSNKPVLARASGAAPVAQPLFPSTGFLTARQVLNDLLH